MQPGRPVALRIPFGAERLQEGADLPYVVNIAAIDQ